MACTDGRPAYSLVYAQSMDAKSIAAVIFEVVNIITLAYLNYRHDFYDIRSEGTTV
jgi:hypothetical protein